jgi:hypothetical protein
MMMKTNPITPPRELVREWYGSEDCPDGANALANYLCTQSAQWGADQELEACTEWVRERKFDGDGEVWSWATSLRAARRPKPPSLRKQAYDALDTYIYGELDPKDKERTYNTIRRALESLDD